MDHSDNDLGQWLMISAGVLVVSYIIATLSWRLLEKPILDAAHGLDCKRCEAVKKNVITLAK